MTLTKLLAVHEPTESLISAEQPARRGGVAALLRGWFVAIAATVPAAALHGAAHGAIPSYAAIIVGIVAAAAIAVPLVGKKWSRWRSAAAISVAQTCYHAMFALDGGMMQITDSGTGHHHHSAVETASQLRAGLAAMGSGHASHGANDGWMLAAHALAAVVSTLLFWYGYACIIGVAQFAGGIAAFVLRALTPAMLGAIRIPAVPATFTAYRRQLYAQWVARGIRGRGPPALA